eukprot:2615868-Rhodomonas_salina.1
MSARQNAHFVMLSDRTELDSRSSVHRGGALWWPVVLADAAGHRVLYLLHVAIELLKLLPLVCGCFLDARELPVLLP